jgi:modification methylase
MLARAESGEAGTTMIATMLTDRNSVGIKIDPEYRRMIARHLKAENYGLFSENKTLFEKVLPSKLSR